MELKVTLFLRAHRSGQYTVQLLGKSDVELFTTNLEHAFEELQLLLGDRIERTHPRLQASLVLLDEAKLTELEVPDAILVEGETESKPMPTRVSVLISENRAWQSLLFPWLGLRLFIAKKEAWTKPALELLTQHFAALGSTERIEARAAIRDFVEQLTINAEPPHLDQFSGKNRDVDMLPPADPTDDEEKKKKDEKKRPPTPTLERIGTSLVAAAKDKELERAHGREKEIDDLLRILLEPGEKAIVLVGARGVGKSTIGSELVYRILDERTPARLRTRPIFFVDASRLVASEGFMGDWQKQCLDVVKECEDSEVICFLGPLLPLLDAGKHIYSDYNIALLLRPFLAAKRFTVIGEASDKDWATLELRDAAFARCFVPYRIAEPAREDGEKIVANVAKELGAREKIDIAPDCVAAAIELSRRYVSEGSASGTAIGFLRRLVDGSTNVSSLRRRDAVEAFSRETGLPELILRDDVALDPLDVERAFTQRLIGQREAVHRMVDLVSVIKSGLSDLSKPLASFLFVGPTGVGKTETAKALASFLFGSDQRLVRFDMSEYVAGDAIHRFLGGRGEEGKLVQAVRARPFAVVLLDELEKAHPAIFDVLLQVLGEARLTDETGRLADFRNTVIVMTSNLGVESLRAKVGFTRDPGAYQAHFVKEAERFFRPELMNRIDHVVAFSPLEREAIEAIAHRELEKMMRREGLAQRDLRVRLDARVAAMLADRGTDPRYGARPLKRTLEKMITLPLARALSGAEHHGTEVEVLTEAESFRFELGENASKKAARGPIHERLGKLELLRYRVDRWIKSRDFVELSEDLRLLDQLAKNPQFWVNRQIAEARVAGMEDKRKLCDAFHAARGRIIAAEDIGYEAFHRRSIEPLALLDEELEGARKDLDRIESELYGRRFEPADRSLVYFQPARGSERFARDLVALYLDLAIEENWSADIYCARKATEEQVAEAEAKAKLLARKKKDDKTPVTLPKRADKYRVVWSKELVLDHGKARPAPHSARRWMADLIGTVDCEAWAAAFQGPHAAGLLSQETGLHLRIESTTSEQTKVLAFAGAEAGGGSQLRHPHDFDNVTNRLRTINDNKHLLFDHRLDRQLPIEPRTHHLYRRFMHAAMYHAVFGAEGPALLEALEQD